MRVLLLMLIGTLCYGQSLEIGLKGGGRVTDDITSWATSESKRYIVGPMIELGLSLGFAVEADALYSRQGYSFSFNSTLRESANQWVLPVLLKYRLPVPIIKPYAEAGWAARWGSGTLVSSGEYLVNGTTTVSYSTRQNADLKGSVGFVVGGGVQFGIRRLRVSPEVRYLRWNSPAILQVISNGPTVESAQNEVNVLVGLGWKLH